MTKVSLYDWPSDIDSLFSVITEQLYKSNIYIFIVINWSPHGMNDAFGETYHHHHDDEDDRQPEPQKIILRAACWFRV